METSGLHVDYLIVGAGAMGMAFADTIVTESDRTVAIVDRGARPGGHWTTAYPFVRLHQPSSFYGVNSEPLGSDRIDDRGGNEGLYELASGSEVVAYFDQVLRHTLLPSGRVHYFPMSEYLGGGTFRSLTTGDEYSVTAAKTVDATYMNVTVPSMGPPTYAVAQGVTCIPPNALTAIVETPSRYVVVGAGKTGVDSCLWLLDNCVDPDSITWIMPRDAWYLDRGCIQPGDEFAVAAIGAYAHQFTSAAVATSIEDLFERLEASGALLRLYDGVEPTMYRCATVTDRELEQLRAITDVVRLGHVRSIGLDAIALDDGTIPTDDRAVHVDCSADGLARRPAVPVFGGDQVTLQAVRTCQQVFSAAFIAHVDLVGVDDAAKNRLCAPVPHPDSNIDWMRVTLAQATNAMAWGADPDLQAWLAGARLDGFSSIGARPDPEALALGVQLLEAMPAALENLTRLIAEADAADH
ncbi:MAG: NAD(P)-binding protein [Acidimicrobiia bacterium]|nr:NAD(P)-binding protein [Acidimicrobiia bacterium]